MKLNTTITYNFIQIYMKRKTEKIHDSFTQEMIEIFKTKLRLNQENYDSIIFLTFLIFQTENGLNNVLTGLLKKGFDKEATIHSKLNNEIISDIIDELTFSSKLNIYEKIVSKYECYADLKKGVSFLRELNSIRNKIFHCKLEKITYRGKKITVGKTKLQIIEDYLKAFGNTNK